MPPNPVVGAHLKPSQCLGYKAAANLVKSGFKEKMVGFGKRWEITRGELIIIVMKIM